MRESAKIAVICGPTATGKTRLSVSLAEELGGEIVSADSMQVYRGMDIGTAKATVSERRGIPHHMIDIIEPDEDYSVSRYVEDASRCIDDILSRGKLPIVTGGTNLYIDSLISGAGFAEAAADRRLRQSLADEYDERGGEELLQRLRSVDPERAEKLHPSDRRRIIRALEVFLLTGETITEHDRKTKELPPRYDAAKLALCCSDRATVYSRIDRRVDEMLERGLLNEVRALLDKGLPPECTAMQAIGYKESAAALRGEITVAQAAELIKLGSRRYAKRQLTWLRRDAGLKWIYVDSEGDFAEARRISTEYLRARGI